MPLPSLEDLLVLVPGVAAMLACAALAWRLARTDIRVSSELLGLAVPIGLFVTWWTTHDGLPAFSASSSERALWGLLMTGPLVLGVARTRGRIDGKPWLRFAQFTLRLALVAGLVYFALRTQIDRGDIALTSGLVIAGLVALVTIGAESAAERGPTLELFVLSMCAGAAAQIALLSGAASLGQLLGTLAMGVGAMAVGVVVLGERVEEQLPRDAACIAALAGVAFVVVCVHVAAEDLTHSSMAALGLAALLPLALRVLPWNGRLAQLGIFVVVVALCGAAVYETVEALPAALDDDPYAEFK